MSQPLDVDLEQRLKRERFPSTKDAIGQALMKALWATDMTEKVNACIAFLALGLNELLITDAAKEAERDYISKLVKWQKAYQYPRLKFTMGQDADKNTVMAIDSEASDKSHWTVPFTDAVRYQRLAMDGLLMQSYQSELLPIVAEMVGKLTKYKILRDEAEEFEPNIDFLLGDEEGGDDGDDEY